MAYLNTSDSSYWISWSNRQGTGMAINSESGVFDFDVEVIKDKEVIIGTFDIIGDTSNPECWGDWTPNSYSPFYTNDDNDTQATPGFETFSLLVLIVLITLLKKKF